jgi:molybdopterin-guanine dinucleotide biosynthesis protein A
LAGALRALGGMGGHIGAPYVQRMRVTGVIQAGGKSTRMGGAPKALLELGGRPIIERVASVLREVVDDVLVVTNTPELYRFLHLPMVPDIFPDHGSLGGIHSGLASASGDAAFTVGCDMPFLRADVARLVVGRAAEADVVIPRTGDQLETLHAVYGKACLPHMEERLRAGRLKIVGFFDRVRVLEIPETAVACHADPAIVFMNVNTPEELAQARTLAGHE